MELVLAGAAPVVFSVTPQSLPWTAAGHRAGTRQTVTIGLRR
jgi:hypothetical protein